MPVSASLDRGPRAAAPPPTAPPDTTTVPRLERLVRAAWRRAGLGLHDPERWQRRARAAAALPLLTVGYDHRVDEGWDLRATYEVPDVLDTDAATTRTLRIRATWELGRAVFSDDELRVAQTHLDVTAQRDRLRREVVDLFERRAELIAAWSTLAPGDTQRPVLEGELDRVERALRLLCGPEL